MNDPVAWIPLIVWSLIFVAPSAKLLGRTGKSAWWLLVVLIPIFGGVVLLYIVAFSKWPGHPNETAEARAIPSEGVSVNAIPSEEISRHNEGLKGRRPRNVNLFERLMVLSYAVGIPAK